MMEEMNDGGEEMNDEGDEPVSKWGWSQRAANCIRSLPGWRS